MLHAPSSSLTKRSLLTRQANSGHDKASSAFLITAHGRDALAAYREKWQIKAVPPSTPKQEQPQ